jgi:pyruvate dehydrogenase E2 component (dihydrolipoamide acetyltransferase)
MPDIAMPRLSDSMEEGTIIRWLKANGDTVAHGEEIVEIETDKANMTYESDQDGVLEIVAEEGATLPIGEVIARIGGKGASASASAAPAEASASAASPSPAAVQPATAAGSAGARRAGASAASAGRGSATSDSAAARSGPVAGSSASPGRPAEASRPAPPARSADEGSDEPAASRPEPAAAPGSPVGALASPASGSGNGRVKASPVARRMATELGLDLAALHGSGPGGRIVKADVEAAAGSAPADRAGGAGRDASAGSGEALVPATGPARQAAGAPVQETPPAVVSGEAGTGKGEVTAVELSRTQQTIARRMAEAKATVPEFAVTTEIDMGLAFAARAQLKAAAGEGGVVPSFNDMVVKACALALREFPRANGSYRDGRFELYSRVNVGVAVAAQDGLVVPTVFDADLKSLGVIATESRALAQRVRSGAITPPELSGGTFTVSNLGMYGVTSFEAIINPPQAGILAVGALREAPIVRDGQVVAGRTMSVTLACDHRILYGADAAEFLARIRALLEAPMSLAL